MKNMIFTTILMLISTNLFSQNSSIPCDSITGKFLYKELKEVNSLSDSIIYSRAKYFLSKKFNNGKYSIDIPNKELQLKGNINSSYENKIGKQIVKTPLPLIFNISIKFKNGKYLTIISDLMISWGGIDYPLEEYFSNSNSIGKILMAKNKTNDFIQNVSELINSDIKKLMNDLYKNIIKQEEDW